MPSHPRLDPAELPECSWDTHVHVFDPARHPYELDSPYIPPPCSVEQLLDAVPCSNFCIVMAMPEGTRPELALESVAKISALPGRTARATIVLDFDRVSNDQLRQLHTAGVRSIRIHTRGAITKGLSGDDALREYIINVAERISPLGWSLDGQLRTPQWVTLAPTIIELHERLGITFVADHCFYLKPEDYGTPAWETCLLLVERGIVYVKISGLDRLVKDNDLAATKDTVIGLATAHNGERCLFGSDWPHVVGQTSHFGEGLMPIDSLFELGYHKQWLSPDTFANMMVQNPRRLYLERGKRLARDPAPLPHIPVADPLDTASTLTTFLGDVQTTPPLAAPATGDSDEWGTLLNLLAHEANGMPGNGLQAGADTGVDLLQGLLAMPSNGNDGWDSWMQFGIGV